MPAAITAVGAVSGFGLGIAPLLAALDEGRTSIRSIPALKALNLCSDLAALAPSDAELDTAAAFLSVDRPCDRASRLILAALGDALPARGWEHSARRGVIVGTTKGGLESILAHWRHPSATPADPLFAPVAAMCAATRANGPAIAVSSACASSTMALGEGLRWIEDGICDEVIVGGTESFHDFVYAGFHALKALSLLPAAPFDAARDGLSLGEGAAVLVLHSMAEARSRGYEPLAVLEGFGSASDSYDQSAPDPRGNGLLSACRAALRHAACDATEVGAYLAHGTATLQNDRMEAAVCAALFQRKPVPVCAIKGALGHTLGASGALDAAVAVFSLSRLSLPRVTNLTSLDPSLPLHPVIGKSQPLTTGRILIGSAGFGGINAAVVLRRPGGQLESRST